MRLMGVEAVGPKGRTMRRVADHEVYPHLLQNLVVELVDQVWSTDITYIPLRCGISHLVTIMD